MQQLIYVPPNCIYGDKNNLTIGKNDTYILSTIEGISGIETSLIADELVGYAGEYVQDIHDEPRDIPGTVYVHGKNRYDMYKSRFDIIKLLTPQLTPGTLYYRNDYIAVKINAYPVLPPNFTERIENYNKCEIKFHAPSPYWSAIEPESVGLAYTEDSGFMLPFVTPVQFAETNQSVIINYHGSQQCGVIINIVAKDEITNIAVSNKTSGEEIKINKTLSANDRITISTIPRYKSVKVNDENAWQYISADSNFFMLYPGNNTISYTSENNGKLASINIIYTALYTGV